MTLIKTASGIWEGDFRRDGVPRLHLSMRTRDAKTAQRRHDAVDKLFRQKRLEMIAQVRAGILTVDRLEAMVEHHEPLQPIPQALLDSAGWGTVDENIAEYLKWIKDHPNRTDATLANAGFQLLRFQNAVHEGQRIGDLPLDRVTSAMVQEYQRAMRAGDAPVNTVTTYMARVAALFNWAQAQAERVAREEHRAPRILYSPVDPERQFREVHRRDRVLTADEATAVLKATPAPLLFPVACGLLAGLRAGETLHLRPGLDVDLEVGTITIKKQPDWKPKTKRSHRLIPMADALHGLAERHTARYANALWMHPSSVDPTRPVTDEGFRAHFKQVVERAGLLYGRDRALGVVYHTLRHTFASHAVMRGVDLYTVAKLLGDSPATVESCYADLSPDHKRIAVTRLAAAFTMPATEGT